MEERTDLSYFDTADDSDDDVITSYIPEETKEEEEDGVMMHDDPMRNDGSSQLQRNGTSQSEISNIFSNDTSLKSSHVLETNISYLQKIQHEVRRLQEQIIHPLARTTDERMMPLRQLSHSCPSLIDEDLTDSNIDNENTKSDFTGQAKEANGETVYEATNIQPLLEAINYNMSSLSNEVLLGVSTIASSSSSAAAGGGCASYSTCSATAPADGSVKIHINDLTPLGSQECLATRNSISAVAKETQPTALAEQVHQVEQVQDEAAAAQGGLSNRQQQQQQQQDNIIMIGLLQDLPVELESPSPAFAALSSWRRRSWSSTEQDAEIAKIKKSLAKTQRSMSLSSLDSETEETFFDACEGATDEVDMTITATANSSSWNNENHHEKQRSFSGSSSPIHTPMSGIDCSSYHSLHEYSIQHIPGKITAFCDDVDFKCSSRSSTLSAPRTTLQKSVSTPSIVAQKEVQEHVNTVIDRHNFSKTAHLESNPDLSLSKRKKRGSIFSRKKRGKEKESKKSSHHFVSVCYSNSAVCHVCNKSMANKPALHCETCLVIVHENSCKDQISDCSQFKAYQKAVKSSGHNTSQVVHSTKRSSVWSHAVPPVNSPHVLGRNKKSTTNSQSKQAQQGAANATVKLTSSSGRVYTPTGYSQWRRVATKLGVNKVISEEKETDTVETLTNIADVNSNSLESLEEESLGLNDVVDLDDDPELKLLSDEPELWSKTVDKKMLKKLKEREVKKQEAIYELILTEKHHCLTLKIMQKIYAQGMLKELQMTAENINRIFPKLNDLLEFHLLFLKQLRKRQQKNIVIEKIGDLVLSQFQGYKADQIKIAYGEFCSNHNDAVSLYKDLLNQDRKFQCFIKKINQHPYCKARQIPECVLLVTQRMMKYPLIIESLIKNTKEKCECNLLMNANDLVKDMIAKIDEQVAENSRKQRLLEIYNKIDAKSATNYRGKKFKKADVLLSNRKLRFEGPIRLNQARGKVLDVIAVILSDVIFFLQESNQKYSFATQDNKAGVISLQKLLVRAKAGQESKGIYLISSNPKDPEMYEIMCNSHKDKLIWIDNIRSAVENCPEEDEMIPDESEEENKIAEAKAVKIQELVHLLHEKDIQLACLCEEKMKISAELMETLRNEEFSESSNFQYAHYMTSNQDAQIATEDIFTALTEAYRLASSLYPGGTSLGRSVSSAGEHHSEAYVSPILPKRAETFGGFDNPNKESSSSNIIPKATNVKKKLNLLKDSECRAASLVNLAAHLEKDSGGSSNGSDPFLNVTKPSTEARRASGPLPYSDLDHEMTEKSSARRSTVSSGLLTPEMAWSDEKNSMSLGISEPSLISKQGTIGDLLAFSSAPSLMSLGKDHFSTATQLSHYLNTLMCLLSKHFTSVVSVKAQVLNENLLKHRQECGRDTKDKRHLYRPNQQLEELRNLQEQLCQDRERWQSKYETEKVALEQEQERLQKLQEHLKKEKDDIQQQRDYLYRYLEVLQQRYGITVSPNMILGGNIPLSADENSLATGNNNYASEPQVESHKRCSVRDLQSFTKESPTGTVVSNRNSNVMTHTALPDNKKNIKSEGCTKSRMNSMTSSFSGNKRDSAHMLPLNLYSATNVQKAASQTPPVRQQLPLKLASHDTSSGSHCHHHSSPQLLKHKEPSPVTTPGVTSASTLGVVHLCSSSSISSPITSCTSTSVTTEPPLPSAVHGSTKSLPDKIDDSNQEIIYF